MGTQRALLPRQRISLERRPPRIVTAMATPLVPRPLPLMSLEQLPPHIGTVMVPRQELRERTKTSLAIQTPPTRIPMDVRLELRLLPPMCLERQPPHIVITTARPSAPRLPQQTSLAPVAPSSVAIAPTRLSGRGEGWCMFLEQLIRADRYQADKSWQVPGSCHTNHILVARKPYINDS